MKWVFAVLYKMLLMRVNPSVIFLSLYLCFDLMPSVFNTHNYVSSSLCACGSALYSVLHDLVLVDCAVTQCRWLDGSGIVKVSVRVCFAYFIVISKADPS